MTANRKVNLMPVNQRNGFIINTSDRKCVKEIRRGSYSKYTLVA